MPRVTSAQQLFEHLPEAFVVEEARGVNAVVQFELTGAGGGDWHAQIADGRLNVGAGRAQNPSVTLTAAAADYLAIVNGDQTALGAFMAGKIKIAGDVNLALRMQQMFRAPSG